MAAKLVNLQIDHIAGVDYPANKRKFLIIQGRQQDSEQAPVVEQYEQIGKQAKLLDLDLTEYFTKFPEQYADYRRTVLGG